MIDATKIDPFKPVQGVIVYKRHASDYYLETHDIAEVDGKYHWQEGRPFLKEQLKDLALSLGNQSFQPLEADGLLPENLLYFKQGFSDLVLAWWLPPARRALYFKKELKLANTEYPLPGLLFAVHNRELYVTAFKGNEKPHADTPLFKAPFHNINGSACVCLGNVEDHKRKGTLQAEIARWERRFFNSYFSHFLDQEVIKQGTNLSVLLKDLAKGKKPFPEDILIPSPYKTVKDFLKNIQ